MANEKRLIDANVLIAKLEEHSKLFVDAWQGRVYMPPSDKARVDEIDTCIAEIINAPTVDAVSKGLFDQIKWERDIAIEQLADYGISLGEKADVTKVVHGRWGDDHGRYVCSACHEVFTDELVWIAHPKCEEPNYCPNCGAKMDGDGNG